jgi:SAM-dependent methyltransferase
MKQSDAMLQWGVDNWLKRNKPDLGKRDPVSDLLDQRSIIKKSDSILEIGCADGWRLRKLEAKYGCTVAGIEPSAAACKEAWEQFKTPVTQGIAASMPYSDDTFDIVIMGFCMWLTDPSEWLRNVAESDRVLKDGGHLIIHDYCEVRPLRHPYNYDAEAATQGNAWCYFFDWTKLWLVHPGYRLLCENMTLSNRETVSVLRKDMAHSVGTPGG